MEFLLSLPLWGEESPKGWTSPKPSPWGEGGWPLGQTDEGAMIEPFRLSLGSFAAPAASDFLDAPKSHQKTAGDAADGLRLRCAPPRSIGPLSPDPYYGGRVPVR